MWLPALKTLKAITLYVYRWFLIYTLIKQKLGNVVTHMHITGFKLKHKKTYDLAAWVFPREVKENDQYFENIQDLISLVTKKLTAFQID